MGSEKFPSVPSLVPIGWLNTNLAVARTKVKHFETGTPHVTVLRNVMMSPVIHPTCKEQTKVDHTYSRSKNTPGSNIHLVRLPA